jgi:predicted RNA-binding Zn-ribbon protein involved in translation (DUF1610 family)
MSEFTEATQAVNQELACTSCGAILKFKPGTHHLACDYCGAQNEIPVPPEAMAGGIQENDLEAYLSKALDQEERVEISSVKCDSCGATTTLDRNVSSDRCPFCASTLVITSGSTARLHKPQYVLPFGVDEKKALGNFRQWIKSLWFAPGDLKHYGDSAGRLQGMYLPYWTFDCETDTSYSGQRGIDYTVTEQYQTVENGKHVTRTRSVTKTRWYPVSGRVQNTFDDILIEATQQVPKDKLRALEPWDVKNFVPYADQYLSGFKTVTYTQELHSAYAEAKDRMEPMIHATINQHIGGDRQRIFYKNVSYRRPTFKHVLMPVWLSAYRYKNKVYQIMINARTGEVQGDRPYSAGKIALAIIGGLIVIGVIAWLVSQK